MAYVNLTDHNRADLCISPTAVISPDVWLGNGVVVDDDVVISSGCKIWHHTVIRSKVRLGQRVVVGHNVVIETGTEIGSDTTIQSQCHITALARIGTRVFLGPMVTMINEKHIASHGRKIPQKLEGPVIGDCARIGARSLLMPGSVIGRQATVAAGSIVKGSVQDGTVYVCRLTSNAVVYPVPQEELLD